MKSQRYTVIDKYVDRFSITFDMLLQLTAMAEQTLEGFTKYILYVYYIKRESNFHLVCFIPRINILQVYCSVFFLFFFNYFFKKIY